jgi:hypothetical protein
MLKSRPQQGQRLESRQLRLQRPDQRVRRPGQGGRARPDQGRAHCPAERRLDRVVDADHRSACGGDSGRDEGRFRPRRPWRHGGYVLRAATSLALSLKPRPARESGTLVLPVAFGCGKTRRFTYSVVPENATRHRPTRNYQGKQSYGGVIRVRIPEMKMSQLRISACLLTPQRVTFSAYRKAPPPAAMHRPQPAHSP